MGVFLSSLARVLVLIMDTVRTKDTKGLSTSAALPLGKLHSRQLSLSKLVKIIVMREAFKSRWRYGGDHAISKSR